MAIRVGTSETIDMETGEVIRRDFGAFTLLPPAKGLCQECGAAHPADTPHNLDSLYYGIAFKAKHGRAATWTDALAPVPEERRERWREAIRQCLTEAGRPIPADLA